MNKFRFYVLNAEQKKIVNNLSLSDAIKVTQNSSCALLGVEDKKVKCDLILKSNDNVEIVDDYTVSRLKDNKLITLNVINVLKREFNL